MTFLLWLILSCDCSLTSNVTLPGKTCIYLCYITHWFSSWSTKRLCLFTYLLSTPWGVPTASQCLNWLWTLEFSTHTCWINFQALSWRLLNWGLNCPRKLTIGISALTEAHHVPFFHLWIIMYFICGNLNSLTGNSSRHYEIHLSGQDQLVSGYKLAVCSFIDRRLLRTWKIISQCFVLVPHQINK